MPDNNDITPEMLPDLLHAARLTARHIDGAITEAEAAELEHWLTLDVLHQEWFSKWQDARYFQEWLAEHAYWQAQAGPALADLHTRLNRAPVRHLPFYDTSWFRIAAVFIVLALTTLYIYRGRRAPELIVKQQPGVAPRVAAGGNHALLKLGDGSSIVLDSAADGMLARQGGMKVLKLDSGKLAYHGEREGGEILYNTISTPKGGQYQVILPDGTKVWLNAASSIRFPTGFTKDRTVEITGESYFEVARDKSKPFLVKAGATTIQVLGTSFNVNAYPDEPAIKTSLSEGVVKIDQVVMKPGQACVAGKIIATDLVQDLAWKNGLFNFNEMPLEKALRQLSNWYDVAIKYEDGVPDITFGGEMKRNLNFDEVLHFMQAMGVHYKWGDGRQLIITR